MCGIVAVFKTRPEAALRATVRDAMERARHRGPDGQGSVFGQGARVLPRDSDAVPDWGLGHVRLSILDLSDAGCQPMSYQEGRLWISYNGEVYNYVELASELMTLGHHFRSHTDTEVVLAAYAQWGEKCVEHFVGMFALVLVDLEQCRVFVARDRLGVKPLYLWKKATGLGIVSEIKQLQAFPKFEARMNVQQTIDFLVDGVLSHDPDQCFFEGVIPLAPGHRLSWPLGTVPDLDRKEPYWSPAIVSRSIGWNEAVERTGDLFRDAVRLRLRSDVPVGSCLSGGVDSSSIVGVASRAFGQTMCTFSSCFPGTRIDEQTYIDAVNTHCHCQPTKVYPKADRFLNDLEALVYTQDEPFGSLSIYAQFCVMREARAAEVPVLLDGQGGDEALCGYRKFAFFLARQYLAQRKFQDLGRHLWRVWRFGDERLFDLEAGERYLPSVLRRRQEQVVALLRPAWRNLHRTVWAESMRDVRDLHAFQWADLRQWSLPALLRYEDRNSMAHSIEARVPFLDHRLLEHCLALPEAYFFHGGRTKRVLVDSLADELPPLVRDRRSKLGFETPQSEWLSGALGEMMEQKVAECDALKETLDMSAVRMAFRRYRAGERGFTHTALFRVASVAFWASTFRVCG